MCNGLGNTTDKIEKIITFQCDIFFLKAMGLMLLPHNAPDAAKNVAYMVDEIWYHAGDTSTDVCSKIFSTYIGLFIN